MTTKLLRAAAEAVARAWGFKSYLSAGPESRAKLAAEARDVIEAARPAIIDDVIDKISRVLRKDAADVASLKFQLSGRLDTHRSAGSLQLMVDPYRKAAAGPTVATGANPLAYSRDADDE